MQNEIRKPGTLALTFVMSWLLNSPLIAVVISGDALVTCRTAETTSWWQGGEIWRQMPRNSKRLDRRPVSDLFKLEITDRCRVCVMESRCRKTTATTLYTTIISLGASPQLPSPVKTAKYLVKRWASPEMFLSLKPKALRPLPGQFPSRTNEMYEADEDIDRVEKLIGVTTGKISFKLPLSSPGRKCLFCCRFTDMMV